MFSQTFSQVALLLLTLPLVSFGRSIPSRDVAIPLSNRDITPRDINIESVNIKTAQASDDHYPRATRLSDRGNSILLGYAHFDGKARTIQVVRSTDDGKSFRPFGQVATRPSNADMDNAFLLEVPGTKGQTILIAFRNHDKDDNGVYTQFRITVCQSKDGGKTWKYLSQAAEITPTADNQLGIWEPFMRIGNDGKIQLTYSKELATKDQETFRVISPDGGRTWSDPVNLRVHSTDIELRDGMQGITSVKDSHNHKEALVMVFETTRHTTYSVEYAVSYDDGATYAHRGVVYEPPKGKNAGSPQITSGKDGLICLFMTDDDVSAADQSWPSVAKVKAVTATELNDGKVTWTTSPKTIGDNNSHWPGLTTIGHKAFGVFDQGTSDSGTAIKGHFLSW
ncbi:dehydrogenase-like protein [Xylariales sp. AK1849]|nr:dehydrogenase-like protein [Xylariales sp. AK1849]